MKTKNIKLLTVVSLLFLAGCTEDTLDEGRGQVPISLTATVECDSDAVYTRAGTGVLNSFANGDAIKVYFPSNVRVGSTTSASSTTYNHKGSSWSPATLPFFNAGASSCTVHAYYPSSHTNSTSSFSVQQDQSGDANYKSSDLMYATATITKSSPSGSLTFAHRMAKIIVNATAGAGVSTITDVRIIGGYRTINISTPQSCALGTTLSNALSTSSYITMYSGGSSGSASCAAMIPPQSISGSFLQVVTNQGTATYSLASVKSFESGKSYQLNITVNAAAVGTTNSIPSWTGAGDVSVNASPWTAAVSGTYTYNNGSTIVPPAGNITVRPVGGGSAISSSKYSVYCENNTNAGTAKLLVYGKDEHFGKFAETTFTIGKKTIANGNWSITPTAKAITTNNTFNITVTREGSGTVQASSSNTSVATVSVSGTTVTVNTTAVAGSATITVSVADEANRTYAGNHTCSVTTTPYPMAASATTDDVGKVICSNGHIHNNVSDIDCGASASGIIAYVGDGDTSDDTYNHGLALALTDASSGVQWGGYGYNCTTSYTSNKTTAIGYKNGIGCTNTFLNSCSSWHNHYAVRTLNDYESNVSRPTVSSSWFIPSLGQWNIMLKALQGTDIHFAVYDLDNENCQNNHVNYLISNVGGTPFDGTYWSCTEYDTGSQWYIYTYSPDSYNTYIHASYYYKSNNYKVRPCFAF